MLGGGNESFYTFRERGEGMIKEEKGRIIREEVTMFLISQIGVPMATELQLFWLKKIMFTWENMHRTS